MEIKGTIIQLLDEQSGESKNGTWSKRDFILETVGEYPKKVCLTIWGDKLPKNLYEVGNAITASIDVESREYNSRWYTDVKCYKIELDESKVTQAPSQNVPAAALIADNKEDLPF
jgi:hypothetical protein